MKGRTLQILLHVTGCLVFLALPMVTAPDFPRSLNLVKSTPTQRDLIAYLLMISFFYFNFFIVISKFYFTKKYFQFFLITILCFFIISFLPGLIIPANFQRPPAGSFSPPNNFHPPRNGPVNDLFATIHYLFIFLAVVFFSLILKISNRWKQSEKEKLNAELSYLKAQINPHFLFNTLNNIYSLALEKSDKTATAVVKLSGMMRYVLSDADEDFVPLEKEIMYIKNYIELQQLRFDNDVKLSFEVNGQTSAKKIAPLILIPFIENAFKHGVNAEEDSNIKIKIDINENNLHLLVINNKVTVKNNEEKNGVGIENTKNRLELLYPSKYSLSIDDNKKYFSVLLDLNLQ